MSPPSDWGVVRELSAIELGRQGVLKTPLEISDVQIDRFANFYKHNARPVQPLSGRVVSESH